MRIGSERTLGIDDRKTEFKEMANRTTDAMHKKDGGNDHQEDDVDNMSSGRYSNMSRAPMIQICSLKSQMDTQY